MLLHGLLFLAQNDLSGLIGFQILSLFFITSWLLFLPHVTLCTCVCAHKHTQFIIEICDFDSVTSWLPGLFADSEIEALNQPLRFK